MVGIPGHDVGVPAADHCAPVGRTQRLRAPAEALHVCDYCFGPLEVAYDYDAVGATLTRQAIASRPRTMAPRSDARSACAPPMVAARSASVTLMPK